MANGEETLEQIRARLEALEGEKELRAELNELSAVQLQQLRDMEGLESKLLEHIQTVINDKQATLEQLNEQIKLLDQIIQRKDKIYSQQVALDLKQEAEVERQKKLLSGGEQRSKQSAGGLADTISQVSGLSKAGGKLGKNSMLSAVLGIGTKRIAALVGPAALAAKIIKTNIAVYDMENAFRRATGASAAFAGSITTLARANRRFGITAQDNAKAMEALYTGFTDFTFSTRRQREELTETVATLEKFGISSLDLTKSIQFQTKVMGESTAAAGQQMLDLTAFAEKLGVVPAQMTKDFAATGNMMAKLGDQGMEAFKDLQISAKTSGLQLEKILRITDKFDTFEGAATMAGELNAMLGGNFVNAMDMMMETEPAKRFDMLSDALQNAGLEFKSMGYRQKKAIAESMELEEIGDLALIMAGRTDLVTESTKKSTKELIAAKEQALAMASFQDQLNAAMAAMIPILTPMVKLFTGFFNKLGAGVEPITKIIESTSTLTGRFASMGTALFSKDVGASTLLEGLVKTGDAFEGIATAMDALPDFAKKGAALAVSMSPGSILAKNTNALLGGGSAPSAGSPAGTETVLQPINITLNGDKMAGFVVETIGYNVGLRIKNYE